MLKKIVLVGALAVASFLSLNLTSKASAPESPAASPTHDISAMWPPPDCQQTGTCNI
jgi:hypothetical protein